ncbi:unnamed protein product [Mytilus edulis]|uniref:MACPF domain-containing protein n=1 Tax=Mytilus edulis TaxID=6550 RepID=A0A8S3QWT3_MYTED|nr:unnamed protein product [Mytilus edulis]
MTKCKNFVLFIFVINVRWGLVLSVYENEPIDSLIDGFRRQQMVMSTTLINASQNLGLPGKLAEAEMEEAEERAMLAFRRKTEAKTPFIATNSRLSLGYIGRGYDIYMGNPVSDDGEVDQGFRLPVIDLPFSFRFTSDGGYRIPDNVDVISETSASFGSSYHQVKTETDYKSMLQVDVSVNAAATVKEVTKGDTTTSEIVGRAIVYKARLSSSGTISKLSDFFEDNIRALPSENCEQDVIQQLYIQVIEQFGTHYTTEVVMGAKAVQEFKFKNSDLDIFQSVGISAKVAAKMSVDQGAYSVSGGFSVGIKSNEEMREMVSSTEKEQREYYIGGSPPSGDYSSGSTESLREWARSAAENPAPIQYKLSSIDSLISPKYFKKTETGLFEKRQCFRKALFRYCLSTIAANHCSLKSESTIDGNPSTFRYGDFVTIRNRNRYLSLSQHYGISPGLTMKPLTTVTTVTNYDGLFQLVSPEGANDKLGLNMHYGEPFLLKTIEGELLHIGKSLILNNDEPEETRLLNLFTNQDEVKVVNISYSPVTDYSIFLKKEHACSYLITIRSFCYHNVVKYYQVQMLGYEGTTSNTITVGNIDECVCPNKSPCGSFWFHTIATDQDIGDIHTIRITGKYGESTHGIWELKIKSIINEEKRQVDWSWGHAKDLKLYPIQFTFQSSNRAYLEGQPINLRDKGFIHILSSVPRSSFWDRGMTHVVSLEGIGEIGIREIGPKPHKPLSAVCNDLIYPSAANISKRYDFEDRILISYDIKVRIMFVEVQTSSALNFSIAYLNEVNGTFMQIKDVERAHKTNMQNFTITAQLYTKAIKISTTKLDNGNNITDIVKTIVIGGCPTALLDTGEPDTITEEWTMELSENVIMTSPYLHVIPRSRTAIDIESLMKEVETPLFQTVSLAFQLMEPQYNCAFTGESLKIDLQEDAAEFKFNIVNVTKLPNKEGQELILTIEIKSLNEDELDRGLMALNSSIRSVIGNRVCSVQYSTIQTDAFEKTTDAATSTTLNTWIVVSICFIGVLQVITLLFLVFKTIRDSKIKKAQELLSLSQPTPTDNPSYTGKDPE